jgi:hypothetical protein
MNDRGWTVSLSAPVIRNQMHTLESHGADILRPRGQLRVTYRELLNLDHSQYHRVLLSWRSSFQFGHPETLSLAPSEPAIPELDLLCRDILHNSAVPNLAAF